MQPASWKKLFQLHEEVLLENLMASGLASGQHVLSLCYSLLRHGCLVYIISVGLGTEHCNQIAHHHLYRCNNCYFAFHPALFKISFQIIFPGEWPCSFEQTAWRILHFQTLGLRWGSHTCKPLWLPDIFVKSHFRRIKMPFQIILLITPVLGEWTPLYGFQGRHARTTLDDPEIQNMPCVQLKFLNRRGYRQNLYDLGPSRNDVCKILITFKSTVRSVRQKYLPEDFVRTKKTKNSSPSLPLIRLTNIHYKSSTEVNFIEN